jgi:hypothetical protein
MGGPGSGRKSGSGSGKRIKNQKKPSQKAINKFLSKKTKKVKNDGSYYFHQENK